MQNLKEKALVGTAWSAIQMWGMRIVNFAVFFILARQLNPEDFGLIALANVYIALVTVFVDQGFTEAIIQRKDLENEHLNTVFWIGVFISALMTVVSVIFAENLSNLFNEDKLTPIIQLLSLNFVLISLSSVPQAILKRELEFKSLALRSFVAALCGGVVGVYMAVQGYGVWSLGGQTLTNQFVGILVVWRVVDWRPGFEISRTHFMELFTFGIHIVGSKVINFFNRRADDFLIGFFLGTTVLGYYTIAYKTLLMLTQVIIQVTQAVALPTFSRLQNDMVKLLKTFSNAALFTAIISFPIFLGVSVTAPILVPIVYGDQWAASVPIVQILMLVGALHSILFYHGSLSIALGATSWRLGLTVISACLNLIAFFIALQWGIIAIAISYTLVNYLMIPLEIWLTKKIMPTFNTTSYLKQFVPPLIIVSLMVSLIWATQYFSILDGLNNNMQLVSLIGLGGLVYCISLYVVMPTQVQSMLNPLKALLPSF